MGAPTTWLCPTPLHRGRMLEMEGKLARPRALMYGSLAFGVATPWVGIGPLALLLIAVLVYRPLTGRIGTSARPST
jgi:hypothetical protein